MARGIEQGGMKTDCGAKASEIEQEELKIRCRTLAKGEMNRLEDVPSDDNSDNWSLAKTLQDHPEVHPNNGLARTLQDHLEVHPNNRLSQSPW